MPSDVVGPYIISHVVAVMFLVAAWRWPGTARFITGIGFILAGIFNIRTALNSPEAYVQGFGPHALPLYREFIYGAFARHTATLVIAIASGQIVVGILTFAHAPSRTWGYLGGIVFLLAITPLGIGSAAPSNLIFAIAIATLLRDECEQRTASHEHPTA